MNRILLFILLGIISASAFSVFRTTTVNGLGDPCCKSCSLPEIKYFSLSNHRCGEGCFNPKDFYKYKVFEPGMTKADTNTPCIDRGYPNYNGTFTHEALGLKGTFDMYVHSQ